jgi:hypothetical protein
MPGQQNFVQGGASDAGGGLNLSLAPGAMQIIQAANEAAARSRETTPGPHSSDMIPAMKGLSTFEFSAGSGSDVSMTTESILGKRVADDKETQAPKLDLSLGLKCNTLGGKTKRGKKSADKERQEDAHMQDMVAARTRKKIATGHSAAGNLTRPNVWSRQAQ